MTTKITLTVGLLSPTGSNHWFARRQRRKQAVRIACEWFSPLVSGATVRNAEGYWLHAKEPCVLIDFIVNTPCPIIIEGAAMDILKACHLDCVLIEVCNTEEYTVSFKTNKGEF